MSYPQVNSFHFERNYDVTSNTVIYILMEGTLKKLFSLITYCNILLTFYFSTNSFYNNTNFYYQLLKHTNRNKNGKILQ